MEHDHLVLDHCNGAAATFTMFWVLLLLLLARRFMFSAFLTAALLLLPLPLCAAAALRKDHSFLLSLSFCFLQSIFFFESRPFFSVICSTDPADFVFTSFFLLCLVVNLFEEVVDIVLPSLFWSSN